MSALMGEGGLAFDAEAAPEGEQTTEPTDLGIAGTLRAYAFSLAEMFPTTMAGHEFEIPFYLPGSEDPEYLIFNTLPPEGSAVDDLRIFMRGFLTALVGVSLLVACYRVVRTTPK
jgi:hypothetical protein